MLKLNITNNLEGLAELAPFMEEVAMAYDVSPDVSFQLQLALDEALANSVSYAYPEGTEGPIIIEVTMEDSAIVFRLIDEGTLFDPTVMGDDVDTDLSAEERAVGGLGIFLIKQMMDDVTYQRLDDKNILTMKKEIR